MVKTEVNSNVNVIAKSPTLSEKKREVVKSKSTPEVENPDKKREVKIESVKVIRREEKVVKSSDRNHVTNDKTVIKSESKTSSNVSASPKKASDYRGRSVEPSNENERGIFNVFITHLNFFISINYFFFLSSIRLQAS